MIKIIISGPKGSEKTHIVEALEKALNTKLKMTYCLEEFTTKAALKQIKPQVLICERQTR